MSNVSDADALICVMDCARIDVGLPSDSVSYSVGHLQFLVGNVGDKTGASLDSFCVPFNHCVVKVVCHQVCAETLQAGIFFSSSLCSYANGTCMCAGMSLCQDQIRLGWELYSLQSEKRSHALLSTCELKRTLRGARVFATCIWLVLDAKWLVRPKND